MRSKLLRSKFLGAAALAVVACTVAFASTPASASMYYPWAGQFPWDWPGTVNPDIISGPLLASSTHWPGIGNYGYYQPTFGPDRACHPGRCWIPERW